MLKKLFKNRSFLSFFFAFLIFWFLFLSSEYFDWINERIKNWFVKTKNNLSFQIQPKEKISENIVVVKIDDESLNKLWTFPLPREYYKKVIENLNEWWALVIGFDIIFADESNKESDDIFAESIKKAWNIVLWWGFPAKRIWEKYINYIEKPLEKFEKNAFGFWYFHLNLSWNTGTALSFSPFSKIYDENFEKKSLYNHFTIALLKAYYSKIFKKDFRDFNKFDNYKYYLKEEYWIPFSDVWEKDVFINYIPFSKNKNSINFTNFSFSDVYEWKINPVNFKDKIVIIWYTAQGIKDTFITLNWIEYWVFVHANILNTIITKNFVIYFDEYFEWILIFLLIIVSIYFNLSRSGYVIIFSNIFIPIMFLFIYPIIIIFAFDYVLRHIFELFLALPFSITTWNIIKYLTENKNKAKLSKALSEYVSNAIVKEILSNSWELKLDWELKKLSIFFSDIEWFTTISEKFSPHELVSFLRNYLSKMSNIILDNFWFINKYEWDAIMALWWAFWETEKDSYYACLSAIEQQKLLKELNKDWKNLWFPEIRARIGLHTWNAIVWNIWAVWRKIEYTALWDSVNLGSRLEWVNKFYWTLICASENIYEENKDFFEFRFLDEITVKWKEKPIKIYELLDLKWKLNETQKKIISEFENAMNKYFSRNFSEAKILFENIFKKYNDKPSKTYLERCDFFIKNKPKDEETLIWKFDSK